MGTRRTLTAQTVAAVAAENSGHPIDPDRAEVYAQAFEAMLQSIVRLRQLPLKQVEPATVFLPPMPPS